MRTCIIESIARFHELELTAISKAERQQFLQVSQEPLKAKAYAYLPSKAKVNTCLIDTYLQGISCACVLVLYTESIPMFKIN